MNEPEIILSVALKDVDLLLHGLGELPLKLSAALHASVHKQTSDQLAQLQAQVDIPQRAPIPEV